MFFCSSELRKNNILRMNDLPNNIKISVLLAIILMVVVVIFLIFIVILYSRKQILFEKQKELRNLEYEKQLLQKEVEFQKKTKIEEERIAHDLHDDVGSGITALKLQVEYLKKKTTDDSIAPNLEEILQTCDDLHISVRQILWNLKVGDDDLENVVQRTIQYAKTFFAKTNIEVHISKSDIGHDRISANTRRSVFLCLKEALNNVYRHSQCNNVEVHYTQLENIFTIDVKDDGIGLINKADFGNGFQNMEARMVALNGSFNVLPSEKGLHIQMKIDLEGESEKLSS